MIKIHKLVSAGLGIGYMGKGGGTVAAVVTCLVWYAAQAGREQLVYGQVALTVLIVILGVWTAGRVELYWGKDDKKVVIDEVAGMCIALVAVPISWRAVLAGLVLFRFFDIAKPLFIRKLEKLKGGWGVMLDDVAAGLYANVLLQLLLYFKIL